MYRYNHTVLLFCFISGVLKAQNPNSNNSNNTPDTLKITIDSAEHKFLRNNLSLLAQRYSVNVAEALILQARLYNNPNFQIGQALYSGPTGAKKFFATKDSAAREENAQITQLIILAQKRKKQIAVAETNTEIAQNALYDLLRTLKGQLRTDFYTILFNQQSLKVYDKEINSLQQIAKVFLGQLSKGYVARKEVLRIQAQLFSLQNEYLGLRQQIINAQADLNLLLATKNVWYLPDADFARLGRIRLGNYPLQRLIDSAFALRYDLKVAQTTVRLGEQQYALQRALATPDVTAGINYDRAAGVPNNYVGLSLGIDLPFFNRNQGNIRGARFQIENYTRLYKNLTFIVQNDVVRAYQLASQNEQLFLQLDPSFAENFEKLTREVLINYQKRNISLLEFLDYYDAFKQNTIQINTLGLNRMSAYEQINLATGQDLFR